MTLPALDALPVRAEGVELLGDLVGSGYRDTPALVRRGDGQTLQLTPLLAHLLDLVDGRRDADLLAQQLTERIGKQASADDVRTLLGKLVELGLLCGPDGAQPEGVTRANPLLALRFKVVVSDPEATRRLTAPFTWLFRSWVVVPVLLLFAATTWWVLVEKGLAGATRSAFYDPELLLLVFALTVVSAGFHEFGHAAATRYGGATPGAMGAGLYLVWPAFYTDVDDSYRLSRWGRLRVDLGGLYFNALVAVGVTAAWLVWREDALLLGVAAQLLQMLRQLAPVIRADGYHILADLTGVPDLFAHMGPTLRALLPWGERRPTPLKRWARVVVTSWVLIVVPLLLGLLVGAVLLLPRMIATAWDSAGVLVARLGDDLGAGDVLGGLAGLLRLVALVIPVLALSYLLVRVVRRAATAAWGATAGRPRARTALLLAAALLAGLALYAWQPGSGRYVPVQASERGTLGAVPQLVTRPASLVQDVPLARTGTPRLAVALVPRDRTAPVLLLSDGADGRAEALLAGAPGAEGDLVEARQLAFDLPDAPGADGNQALATGTVDGATAYDVAYALVWVEDGRPVTARNEAYALATCTRCTTVSIAFQIVLVVGRSDVQVPVNTAVAANGGCVECVTQALAVQLVASLRETPSDVVRADVERAFGRLAGLEAAGADPATMLAAIGRVEAEVLDVLVRAGLVDPADVARARARPSAATSTSPSAGPSSSASPGASATPTADPTSGPDPQGTADPSLGPDGGSTAEPEATSVAPSPAGSTSGSGAQTPAPRSSPSSRFQESLPGDDAPPPPTP